MGIGLNILAVCFAAHTIRPSYAALGLAVSHSPRASGGTEGAKGTASALSDPATRQAEASGSQLSSTEATRTVPKGYGRIVRDDEGNIVDVEMDEDEGEAGDDAAVVDHGGLVEDKASTIAPDAVSWVTGAHQHPDARTDIVQGRRRAESSTFTSHC